MKTSEIFVCCVIFTLPCAISNEPKVSSFLRNRLRQKRQQYPNTNSGFVPYRCSTGSQYGNSGNRPMSGGGGMPFPAGGGFGGSSSFGAGSGFFGGLSGFGMDEPMGMGIRKKRQNAPYPTGGSPGYMCNGGPCNVNGAACPAKYTCLGTCCCIVPTLVNVTVPVWQWPFGGYAGYPYGGYQFPYMPGGFRKLPFYPPG